MLRKWTAGRPEAASQRYEKHTPIDAIAYTRACDRPLSLPGFDFTSGLQPAGEIYDSYKADFSSFLGGTDAPNESTE